jgi:hypothetical protein
MFVEYCDEVISKENDNLNLKVKRLEQKVSVLQVKSQSSQDNRRNIVNKLEKRKTVSKLVPQQKIKHTHHKKK